MGGWTKGNTYLAVERRIKTGWHSSVVWSRPWLFREVWLMSRSHGLGCSEGRAALTYCQDARSTNPWSRGIAMH